MHPSLFLHRHKWKLGLVLSTTFVIGGVYAMQEHLEPLTIVPIERGDLRETVKAVGIVTSERERELRFASSGIVSDVLVQEGEYVTKGQKIATLPSGRLTGEMITAKAAVESARKQLEAILKGTRSEDIAVAQAQVESKRAAIERLQQKLSSLDTGVQAQDDMLAATREEASVQLADDVSAMRLTLGSQYSLAKVAIETMESLYERLDVQDAVTRSASTEYALMRSQWRSMADAINAQVADIDTKDTDEALKNMERASNSILTLSDLVRSASDFLSLLPFTNSFTTASRDLVKNSLATQQSLLQGSLATLHGAAKELRDAPARIAIHTVADTAVRTTSAATREEIEADIRALEQDLRVEEAKLQLKKAPPLQTDIDLALARVQHAEGDLLRISSQYQDTALFAPVDGTISRINIRPGQFSPLTDPAITMHSAESLSVLVNISDDDVLKISPSSLASIRFDALPETPFPLRVDTVRSSSTKIGGVDSYRVLDFVSPPGELNAGMSGMVTVVLSERQNVLKVPQESIEQKGERDFLRIQRGDETLLQPVVTGMRGDSGEIEILEGITPHDALIVRAFPPR